MDPPLGKFAITLFLMCNIAEIKIRQHGSPSTLSFSPEVNLSTGQKLKSHQPKVVELRQRLQHRSEAEIPKFWPCRRMAQFPSQTPHLWFRMRWIIIHSGLMP